MIDLRTVDVVQYLQPLREGGSLPAIVEASDEFLYVLKFKGAGQGKKALVAELIGGLLAQAIGLKVPEIVLMNLDDSFSKTEPDQEIQDLLRFSVGLNLGLHFLSGAITYDPLVSPVDPLIASKVVLLDSIITNIDRTIKNTNLLVWKKDLWLIDHGAALYFQHNLNRWKPPTTASFAQVVDHVLLPFATAIEEVTPMIRQELTNSKVEEIINLVPMEWLQDESTDFSIEQLRNIYSDFLMHRIHHIDQLSREARDAR